ncbi:MAG: hypothetical protein ACMXYF_01310 [Candidatus Woesearchaeota archaeon]
MKIEILFYTIGTILLIVTLGYFSYQYIFDLPDIIKAVILGCLTVIIFVTADVLQERDV